MKIQNFICEENPHKIETMVDQYLLEFRNYLLSLSLNEAKRECISGMNRFSRQHAISSLELDIYVNVGDIVYCDFGQAYLNESGFQHFGLVVALFCYKAFVVPMSSNQKTVKNAPNHPQCISPKEHLYYIGQPKGMHRDSVLFLNDGKFINTARIIDVKANLNPRGNEFLKVLSFYKNLFC